MTDNDRSIAGVAKTIAEVLANKKYAIDYYQREYKWESKQIAELGRRSHDEVPRRLMSPTTPARRSRSTPATTSGRSSSRRRATSLRRRRPAAPHEPDAASSPTCAGCRRAEKSKVKIDDLIFSERYGEKSFNLDVPDRNDCMQALFDHGEYEPPADDRNRSTRSSAGTRELDAFSPKSSRDALPYFIDWLKDRVQLVQITAYNDDDAYAIFETMNDRGLKLTPADMLKGYLLANMEDGKPRTKANDLWRKRLRALEDRCRGCQLRLPQDLASQPVRHEDPRAQEGRSPGGLGPDRHRVPPWLRDDHQRVGLKAHATTSTSSSSATWTSTASSTSGSSMRPGAFDPTARSASSATTPTSASRCRTNCCWRRSGSTTAGRPSTRSWRSSAGSPTSCWPGASGTSARPPTRRCSTPCSTSCATSAVSTPDDLAQDAPRLAGQDRRDLRQQR